MDEISIAPNSGRLAAAFVALAHRCRSPEPRRFPFGRSPSWADVQQQLQAVGCPRLLDGIELPEGSERELGVVTSEFLDQLPANPSPTWLAFLPSHLLQTAIPPRARKARGEFYTPKWAVELALNHVGWPSPGARLTDPTCGAGAFVAAATLALRSGPTLQKSAASRITGADINPIAVLGARVACLCAVADLLEPGQPFEPDIRVADTLSESECPTAEVLVGNPPWIRYSDLAPDVQMRVAEAAQHYDLVPRSSFHGGSELDVSAVFAYRMIDVHLRDSGKAALVMPSTLLRSSASAGFRAFRLPDGTPFRLNHVTDFGSLRVFPDATNRTALLCWTKGQESEPEVPGLTAAARGDTKSGVEVAPSLRQAVARFVGEDRRIALFPPGGPTVRLDGSTEGSRGRKGITTDLNGAYFVRVLGSGSKAGLTTVVNDVNKRGKAVPVHTFEVEEELLFPLLKGAGQIRRFSVVDPAFAAIVPNRRVNRMVDEATFRDKYPAAHAHFVWVEEQTQGALSKRSTYRRMFGPGRAPFFSIYNVGTYSFVPIKVVWAEIAKTLVAGIAHASRLDPSGPAKVIIPDHKIYFASFDQEQPALFLCALLNSKVVRTYVDAITEKLQVGAVLDRVRLPAFDPQDELHRALVTTARMATTDAFDGRLNDLLDEQALRVLGSATS